MLITDVWCGHLVESHIDGSEAPSRISVKLGINDYVMRVTTRANPCGATTQWVVWANK